MALGYVPPWTSFKWGQGETTNGNGWNWMKYTFVGGKWMELDGNGGKP